jgi:exportin-2 (importin alpha re-exporter)
MRVVLATRTSLAPIFAPVLEHLVKIMTEVSKNPSNPKFNHFLFESVSALVRYVSGVVGPHARLIANSYVGAARPDALSTIETSLFPPFQYILAQDVTGALVPRLAPPPD